MDISIITPIYKGNRYIDSLILNLEDNLSVLNEVEIELILVNDSPEIDLKYDLSLIKNLNVKEVINTDNLGIHKSRIQGIKTAMGEYIIMLDQDDYLERNALKSQLETIEDGDVVVGNGYNEDKDGKKKPLFKNFQQQQKINNLELFFYIGNLIVSPGMCMLRRNKIPENWYENTISINGADDWLLWLEYLVNGINFKLNPEKIYTHKNVGTNVSNNEEQMYQSALEVVKIANLIVKNQRLIDISVRRINMRHYYEGRGLYRKIFSYFKNYDIAWKLLLYKIS
ncbi:glycosyltransferase family 2 protein [Enterococcus sp. LJL90]